MNNLQSAVSSMNSMKNSINKHMEEINASLKKLGLERIDTSSAQENIESQIKSADCTYTIAMVGTFKAGKSTIINSLLELKGEDRLSSKDDQDTAKAIRLVYRVGDHCEAEVDFGGAYPTEQMTWKEARKYTSHVEMERESEAFRRKAEAVDEVRYYVPSPFLKTANILDLPGTGVGTKAGDIEVARRKMKESDCCLWVVSTDSEPDKETIANLEEIRHKVVPIINVWQIKAKEIEGQFSAEEIKDLLQNDFSAYFASADSFITYYAGEVDYAQLTDAELDPAWGKEILVDKVLEIISEATSGDRAKRIEANLKKAVSDCERELLNIKDNPQLQRVSAEIKRENTNARRVLERLTQCKKTVNGIITMEAKRTANELIDIISEATTSFIEMTMHSLDFSALAKKRYAEKLDKEFRQQLDLEGTWVKSLSRNYADNLKALLDGKYSEFAAELEDVNVSSADAAFDTGSFKIVVSDICTTMFGSLMEKIVPIIIKIVGQIVLALIPGLDILDTVAAVTITLTSASSLSKTDKLESSCRIVVRSARVKIKQQGYVFLEKFKEIGDNISGEYYTAVRAEAEKQGVLAMERVELVNQLAAQIEGFEDALNEQRRAAAALFN